MLWWKLRQVRSPDVQTRRRAVQKLAESKDPKALNAICNALDDEAPDVRSAAEEILSRRTDSDAMAELRWAVTFRADSKRGRSSAKVLASLPGQGGMASLAAALRECAASDKAEHALGDLRGSESVDSLIALLQHKDLDHTGRKAAITVLGSTGDPRAVGPLISALADSEWHVQIAAVEALAKIADRRALQPMCAALMDKKRHALVREKAARALVKLGGPAAVDSLVSALADTTVENAAAIALEKIGDPRGLEARAKWLETIMTTPLEAILVVFNRDFPEKGAFVESILTRMRARGRTYEEWMRGSTPLHAVVHPNAQDPTGFLALAKVEFQRLLNKPCDLGRVEYATFEGSAGVCGTIVTLWNG